MYPTETINQVIELRARNISVRTIAEKLSIDKNTVQAWSIKYKAQIANLRAIEMEAIQERVLPNYELTELAEDYKRVTAELRTRDYDYEPTGFLANRQITLLSRISKLRELPATSLPEIDAEDAQPQN